MSVRRSAGPSIRPVLFSNDKYGRFWGLKAINDTVVASDVPPRHLFLKERFHKKRPRRPGEEEKENEDEEEEEGEESVVDKEDALYIKVSEQKKIAKIVI